MVVAGTEDVDPPNASNTGCDVVALGGGGELNSSNAACLDSEGVPNASKESVGVVLLVDAVPVCS